MVAQKGLNGASGNGTGQSPLPAPSRGIFLRVSELVVDVFSLCELQVKLFAADGRETLQKILVPIIILAVGSILLVFCIPLAMAASVVALVELGNFTWLQGIGLGLGIWLILGGGIALAGLQWLQARSQVFERSLRELDANATWVRTVLQQFAGKPAAPTDSRR